MHHSLAHCQREKGSQKQPFVHASRSHCRSGGKIQFRYFGEGLIGRLGVSCETSLVEKTFFFFFLLVCVWNLLGDRSLLGVFGDELQKTKEKVL